MGKQDIDKIVRSIEDGVAIYKDVKEAKESGNKITLLEGGALFVKHGGKAFRFFTSLQEIGEEIVDLESDEAEELIAALTQIYNPEDPLVKEGCEKLLEGALLIKEGIEELITAKEADEPEE